MVYFYVDLEFFRKAKQEKRRPTFILRMRPHMNMFSLQLVAFGEVSLSSLLLEIAFTDTARQIDSIAPAEKSVSMLQVR
jgi:hypothetical protein